MKKTDPIDHIQWMPAASLTANGYNPNHVAKPELVLLERSILTTGWIQPILATNAGQIIDGFHRWLISTTSAALIERYAGKVPVATLDLSVPEAMMMTIRINRAKGTHAAIKMSGIIQALINDHGLEPQQVADNIGAHISEINLLLQEDVFATKNIAAWEYSKAWEPEEYTK